MLIAESRVSGGADGSNPGPHGAEARTRERQTISERGPLTAAALASRWGLTPAPVRRHRHLDLLAEQGAIEERAPADGSGRGRGLPARAFILSEAGHARLNSDDDVATSGGVLSCRTCAGANAGGEFTRERSAELEARYAAQLAAAGEDVTARTQTLAAALSAAGVAAARGLRPTPGHACPW